MAENWRKEYEVVRAERDALRGQIARAKTKPKPRLAQRTAPADFEHIRKRWTEQNAKVEAATKALHWWKLAAAAAWLFVLILLLVLVAQ